MDSQMVYIMLAMPALFGMTLLGDGIYKMSKMEHGWGSVVMGSIFLMVVAFGFFYLGGFNK